MGRSAGTYWAPISDADEPRRGCRDPFRVPEAAVGGPIALIQEGDIVTLDIPGRQLNVKITEEELTDRQAKWQPLPPNYTTGALAKYAKLVSSASQGAVTH